MALKKYCIIALVTIMVMVLCVGSAIPVAAGSGYSSPPEYSSGLHTGQMEETYTDCNNSTWSINRTFEYYIPSSYTNTTEVPLLFSFHGLGSNGMAQIDLTKFDVLAEREGFIAVFPDATALDSADPGYPGWSAYIAAHNWTLPELTGSNIMWNCGDITGIPIAPLQYCAGVDDVGFVSDMVDWFETNYKINTSYIYSTGMSNGAMFSYLLATNLTGTFAGIAPVAAPMPLNLGWNATTPDPITVIVMRGDSDPIIPEAGECSSLMCDYFSYTTDDTIKYWCEVDNIPYSNPVETIFGPTTADPTVVHRYVYSGGTGGTQVILCWINGAGHTWPGGVLYSPFVGAVTSHIDGSAQIWKYLPPLKYYLKISHTLGGSVTTPGRNTFANVNSNGASMFFYPGSNSAVVNLVATPSSESWEFVNWTGDVSTIADVDAATTTMTITPNRDYAITANFQVKSEEPEPEPGPMTPGGLCFIATAAYGTSTAKQLDVLRDFRDAVLLKSTAGSRLVDLYYQVSPPIADFISEDAFVRTLVKELMIDPIVWVVEATGDMWWN
jgi:polyhydroxybutyrate depolymerase